MRMLFVTGACFDFGIDMLYDGLQQLGHEVWVWPFQRHYHRTGPDGAHWEEWSDEFTYPAPTITEEAIRDALASDYFDCAIFTTLRDQGPDTARRLLRRTTLPIVGLDMGDERVHQPRAAFEEIIGRPLLAYFAREHPNATAGELPLSFSFPRRWITPPHTDRSIAAYFRACWAVGNRVAIARAVATVPGAFVDLYAWGHRTVDVLTYFRELRQARIAVVAAGGGWDTMRLWEAAGSGCVLVVERPPFFVDDWFTESQVCSFTTPDEAAAHVRRLMNDPGECRERAERTFSHFLAFHTTEARAAKFCRRLIEHGVRA